MLFINKSAVHLHLARVRKKLGARNTLELVYLLYGENQQSLSRLKFTPRGKDFFHLFIRGYSDSEIATKFGYVSKLFFCPLELRQMTIFAQVMYQRVHSYRKSSHFPCQKPKIFNLETHPRYFL